jgi:hypothetical protein
MHIMMRHKIQLQAQAARLTQIQATVYSTPDKTKIPGFGYVPENLE